MEKEAKLGWSALRIIGAIYTPLGGLFLLVGVSLWVLLPEDAKLIGMIFTPIGGLFFLLGVIFLMVEYGKKKKMDGLIEDGHFVWAEVVSCELNYNVRVNHRHPSQLIASYTDGTGLTHRFRSQDVYIYDTQHLLGRSVKVYADADFRHYYVDVEPLLSSCAE